MVSHSARALTLAALLAIAVGQEIILTDGSETVKLIRGVPVKNYNLAYKGNTRTPAVMEVMSEPGDEDLGVVKQEESWIAVFKKGAKKDQIKLACDTAGASCIRQGGNNIGFIAVRAVSEDTLAAIVDAVPGALEYFEPNLVQRIPETYESLKTGHEVEAAQLDIWNLQRIGASKRPAEGAGTNIFIIDTGINTFHEQFGGRAIPWADVYDDVDCSPGDGAWCAMDENGHGTHVAGTAAGRTVGVAPAAKLYAIKALGADGAGTIADILMAMSKVADSDLRPAVVTMSLGGPKVSAVYEDAVDALMDQQGVVVVVAAGNEFKDACNYSPAYVARAITVGATDSDDLRSSFSNWGSCIDIFAPGTDILSADYSGGTKSLDGTSMSAPHVSGAAAILLGLNPTQSNIVDQLRSNAGTNYIERLSPEDRFNKLLYVGDDAPPPTQSPRSQMTWPSDEFFASCGNRGVNNLGPIEEYGMANCACLRGTTCFDGSERGCPISPELARLQEFNPGLVLREMFWQWECELCDCIDEAGASRSGLAFWAVALLVTLALSSAGIQ